MNSIKLFKKVTIYLGKPIIFIIKVYQKIKKACGFKPICRFYPTCSQYAIDAINKYGIVKGSFLAIKRILKCHPFNRGGYDPIK